jgi:hypothetical protein
MKKGDTWTGAYQGHAMVRGSFRETGVWDLYSDRTFIQMDPFTKGEIQKEMMKERFAEEVRYLRMLSWVYYYFFFFRTQASISQVPNFPALRQTHESSWAASNITELHPRHVVLEEMMSY